MAHKTFISYKYSESVELRDKIISSLKGDARYYCGETSDSPNLTDESTEKIKNHLKQMIYGTSVTIVIASPKMKESKWMAWEIEYSLKEITREDTTSRSNGVVIVAQKDANGSYDWLITQITANDKCRYITHNTNVLHDIINRNRHNRKKPIYKCELCKTVDALEGSYMSIIKEDEFLKDPNKYINNAFDKSQKIGEFKISKQV